MLANSLSLATSHQTSPLPILLSLSTLQSIQMHRGQIHLPENSVFNHPCGVLDHLNKCVPSAITPHPLPLYPHFPYYLVQLFCFTEARILRHLFRSPIQRFCRNLGPPLLPYLV